MNQETTVRILSVCSALIIIMSLTFLIFIEVGTKQFALANSFIVGIAMVSIEIFTRKEVKA